ncbi:hemerythrin domain-containing protein [Microbacterium sp. 4R-513]|uniref:hemerythrin domain-containing protein n=1 Tax=Microbacterium sp. 4R-513 TaxID=2567934 RepID=UPI0013E208EC|nr:hemerythrin domain-containing protein [Microbacterium sp. 4R-513]QIG40683.1 hemerythrin domain-containing protein [Microbacterium sp. 4R-513]
MAVALPASGDVPSGAGCDPQDLVFVHDAFRRLYAIMPTGVRATEADRRRVEKVVKAVGLVNDALHHHHVLEDDLFWDRLEQRRPACAVHVELMKHHHAQVAVLLTAAPALLEAWSADPAADTAEAVAEHLEAIGALLEEHLAKEERLILPVIAETFTEKEWETVGEEAQKGYARSQIFLFLGLIQDSMTRAQLDEFLAEVPTAIRLLYRLYGKRRYEKDLALLSAGTVEPGSYSARPESSAP